MYEHEERINAQEEMKKNLDLRNNKYGKKIYKQQIKARSENINALVRNSF